MKHRWQRRFGWLLAAALAALLLAELVLLACRPVREREWYEAALIESAQRIGAGERLYPDPRESLLPPATPYGPALPLAVAGVELIAPRLTDFAPRVLGILAVGAMALALIAAAVRMGAGRFEAVAGTLIVLSLLATDWEFRKLLGLGPDIVVLAATLFALPIVLSIRAGAGGWARPMTVGLLVLLACLTKQSGLAVAGGLFVYALAARRGSPPVRRGSPDPAESADRRSPKTLGETCGQAECRGRETAAQQGETAAQQGRHWRLAAAIAAGAAVAVSILAVWPGAVEHTVSAMGRHPYRPLAGWVTPTIDYLARVLWPPLVLGLAGFVAAARRRPATFWIVLAIVAPLAIVQLLSRFKAGGTNSNWIAPTLALLPIGLAALTRDVRRPLRRAALAVAMIAAGLPLARDARRLAGELPAQRAAFARQVEFLARRYPGARVLASADHYHALRRAGLRLETDSTVVSHYLLAGEPVEGVERAIAGRHYDVVILDAAVRATGPDRRLLRLIHAHYRESRLPPGAPFETILVPRLK